METTDKPTAKPTDKWITLRAFSTPIEAQLARGHLESEGVPCFIRDEHTIGMNWLYSNLLGGVKIQVAESDLARAREILAAQIEEEAPPPVLRCPECGSDHVQDLRNRKGWSLISAVFLGLPLPFAKKPYRCEACGHAFRMRS